MREHAEQQEGLRVSVLTLNCWGLWLVSRRQEQRVAALAEYLRSAACKADVVLLQECWVEADVELLRQAGAEGRLPHSHHYSSGAIGSGLLTLSSFPIAEVAFHPYSARGDPAAVLKGDFYAGKGVGWAALDTPLGLISVFNTHLSANYGQLWQWGAPGLPAECRLPRDPLAGVRLLQVLELAAFVAARSQGTAGVLLGGDLNAAPDTLEIAVLQALLPQLCDAWAASQPLLLGATANALECSFTTVGAGHKPARIDYLLTSARPVSAELALADTGAGCSYSDHLAVTAELVFGGSDGGQASAGASPAQLSSPVLASSSPAGRFGPGGRPRCGSGEQRLSPACSPDKAGPAADGSSAHQGLQEPAAAAGALPSLTSFPELMHWRAAPFQHAASAIEQAARDMRRGRRQLAHLAVALLAAGVGCLGTLAARPWWQQCDDAVGASYLALLSGMGAAFGWTGALAVASVGRGLEMRALQQAAQQLRRVVGFCEAIS